jgi:hypothetical protein
MDLEQELLQCALEDGAVSEEDGVRTWRSGDGVASGATHTGEEHAFPTPGPHPLRRPRQAPQMHGEWGQDKLVLWLWPGRLKDAVEQNLSSLAFARYNLRESGEWGCAVASWQEGTFLNMSLACLEVFGRCDERLNAFAVCLTLVDMYLEESRCYVICVPSDCAAMA